MLRSASLLFGVAIWSGCATSAPDVPTRAVEDLDVAKYQGTWFEIAKYPQPFQRGCTCTTATYEPLEDGDLRVVNRCREDGPRGDTKMIKGRASRPDPVADPGKLRVSFFGPFSSPYWVIDRGAAEDGRYPWAVVSDDEGSTLWILSRTPTLDEDVYQQLRSELDQQGFDLSRLDETQQQGCWIERDGRIVERRPPSEGRGS